MHPSRSKILVGLANVRFIWGRRLLSQPLPLFSHGETGLWEPLSRREDRSRVNEFVLLSTMPPDWCEAQLQAATDPDDEAFKVFLGYGSRPFFGRVSGRSIRLRKKIPYRNPLQPYLTGTLEDYDDGTVLRGRFSINPFFIAFLVFWCGGVIALRALDCFSQACRRRRGGVDLSLAGTGRSGIPDSHRGRCYPRARQAEDVFAQKD